MKAALCYTLTILVALVSLNCDGHHQSSSPEDFVEPPNPIETYLPLELGTQWVYDYYVRTKNIVEISHTGQMCWTVSRKQYFDHLIVYGIDVRKDDTRIVGGLCAPNPGSCDTTKTIEEYGFDISVNGDCVAFSGDRFELGLVTNCFRDSTNFVNVPDTVRYACRKKTELANEILMVKNVGLVHRVYHCRDLPDDITMTFDLTGCNKRP